MIIEKIREDAYEVLISGNTAGYVELACGNRGHVFVETGYIELQQSQYAEILRFIAKENRSKAVRESESEFIVKGGKLFSLGMHIGSFPIFDSVYIFKPVAGMCYPLRTLQFISTTLEKMNK